MLICSVAKLEANRCETFFLTSENKLAPNITISRIARAKISLPSLIDGVIKGFTQSRYRTNWGMISAALSNP